MAHVGYDAVNVDAGLLLGVGNNVRMRLFGGLQIARINQSLTTHFLSPDGSIAFTDLNRSVFSGVGPRLGTEVHYSAGRLDFLCGIAGFLLMGGMQSYRDFFSDCADRFHDWTDPQWPILEHTELDPSHSGPRCRMGASYVIPVGNFGALKCELGYQAAAYIAPSTNFLSRSRKPGDFQSSP